MGTSPSRPLRVCANFTAGSQMHFSCHIGIVGSWHQRHIWGRFVGLPRLLWLEKHPWGMLHSCYNSLDCILHHSMHWCICCQHPDQFHCGLQVGHGTGSGIAKVPGGNLKKLSASKYTCTWKYPVPKYPCGWRWPFEPQKPSKPAGTFEKITLFSNFHPYGLHPSWMGVTTLMKKIPAGIIHRVPHVMPYLWA